MTKTRKIILLLTAIMLLLAAFLAVYLTRDKNSTDSENSQTPSDESVNTPSSSVSDGYWQALGHIFRPQESLKENQINYAINLIKTIYDEQLSGMNVYLSVIPEKNHYASQYSETAGIDTAQLIELLAKQLPELVNIDITDTLNLDSFYRSDLHWDQTKLFPVVKKLAQVMGFEYSDKDSYTESVLEPYHGIYWEYSDGTLEADSLIYLENDDTRLSEVSGIQDQSSLVYDPERFCELDGYNIFLSGSQPLLTIKCPSASSEKRLVIFRDSFASSLAPLLTGSYSEITLIDLRYIPSSMLSEYIEFTDQDVLFMLSSTLFNRATLMR